MQSTASNHSTPAAALPLRTLYTGFVLGGFATVMLGPLLPLLSTRFFLSDAQAGSLFTAQFAASTLGSVLSSRHHGRSLVFGYAFIALGIAVLAFANYAGVLAAFSLVGFGIGLAVTATNLVIGAAALKQRGTLLTQANFFWGLGAVVCPQLIALAERLHSLRILLSVAAIAVAVVCAALSPRLAELGKRYAPNTTEPRSTAGPAVFLFFGFTLLLYVGAEMSPARASLMASTFWLSLVMGRAIAARLLRSLSEATVLIPALIIALAGTSLLLTPHKTAIVLTAVIISGTGCGPAFPLIVSRLLARVGQSPHTGWVFAICGSGGAILPWLTGFLSTHTGSLRIGFAVPFAALLAILFLVVFENRSRRQPAHDSF
jgi:FHS family glucose/mannose:H+ symporter-like MFS transporter